MPRMTASLNHIPPKTPDLTSRKVAIKSKPRMMRPRTNYSFDHVAADTSPAISLNVKGQ